MDNDIKESKYGFIGAGNMAWAIFQKLLQAGIPAENCSASAPSMRNLNKWKSAGANVSNANGDIITSSNIIFLAMKPQHFIAENTAWLETCMVEDNTISNKLVISVMAGLPINLVSSLLIKLCRCNIKRIVRVMPNTPLCVGFGCSVVCQEPGGNKNDVDIVKTLLSGNGSIAEQVPEKLIDAAGAVAGCGPAYFYQMIEAMADGAVKQGVPRELAVTLTAQTMIGAAQMVLQTGKHPGLLKDEVCSPSGTTIAGLYALKKANNFSVAVMDAIEAATNRSKELVSDLSPKM